MVLACGAAVYVGEFAFDDDTVDAAQAADRHQAGTNQKLVRRVSQVIRKRCGLSCSVPKSRHLGADLEVSSLNAGSVSGLWPESDNVVGKCDARSV